MDKAKSPILLVLTDDTYIRNYATSGAFDELFKVFDVDIAIDGRVSLRGALENLGPVAGEFEISADQARLHNLHFQLIMWRFRKKSKTFFYRWLRNTNWSLIQREGPLRIRLVSFLGWLVAAMLNPNGFRIPILANAVVFPFVSRFVRGKIEPNAQLRLILGAKPYVAVLFPSSAFEPAIVDLANIGKDLHLPTLCLIDNWDNLTSKTIFWTKPEHLGVWGQQAFQQALDVHGFSPETVHTIGTPRFESYFTRSSAENQSKQYPFPYILFVGSAMPFDEIGALRSIEHWLQKSDDAPRDLMVVYRPHPWQQKRSVPSVFTQSEFSRVVLDRQISAAMDQGVQLSSRSSAFQPSLSYYPALLRGASCVVGPLTTMLLEATICLRPTVGLSYFDGHHANTSKRYFTHFEGMDKVPGFSFCENHNQLTSELSRALLKGTPSQEDSRKQTDYFVTSSPGTYSQRLLQLVLKVSKNPAAEHLMTPKL